MFWVILFRYLGSVGGEDATNNVLHNRKCLIVWFWVKKMT